MTARASDDLLCFPAARLVSDPAGALLAVVRVGEAPVGLAAVHGGSLVVVADSNRFGASGATADLDVVNVAAALSSGRAVVGHIASGSFPREMALLPDGTLLVTNYDSGQVEAVDVANVGPSASCGVSDDSGGGQVTQADYAAHLATFQHREVPEAVQQHDLERVLDGGIRRRLLRILGHPRGHRGIRQVATGCRGAQHVPLGKNAGQETALHDER